PATHACGQRPSVHSPALNGPATDRGGAGEHRRGPGLSPIASRLTRGCILLRAPLRREEPLANMLGDGHETSIVDRLAISAAHRVIAVAHDPIDCREVSRSVGDRSERVPERVEPQARALEFQLYQELVEFFADAIDRAAVLPGSREATAILRDEHESI